MLYLYLDESGDLGFDFINKRPSRFFTICVLAIYGEDSRQKVARIIDRTIRRKLNPKNKRKRFVQELKGKATTLDIKKYFYRNVKKVRFDVYSITLNKKRVYSRLVANKSRVYNWVARMLLEEIDLSGANTQISFILDKSKSKPEILEFNRYVLGQLEGRIDPNIPLKIFHRDSCEDKCLNAVDLFAWGVFRKYERKDGEWFNVFEDRVRFDSLYLP